MKLTHKEVCQKMRNVRTQIGQDTLGNISQEKLASLEVRDLFQRTKSELARLGRKEAKRVAPSRWRSMSKGLDSENASNQKELHMSEHKVGK